MARRVLGFVLKIVGAFTIAVALCAIPAMIFLGSWLQYETPLQKADYIVPLAGDDYRLLKAAELYRQGLAPVILLSNAHIKPPGRLDTIAEKLGHPRPDEREWRRRLLDYMAVPVAATAEFGDGHISTVEEAEALRRHIGDRSARIIIVTSPYHTRRAKIIFESVMPKTLFMFASPPEGTLGNPWWRDQTSALLAVTETAKLAYFWLGGAFRKAAPAQP